MIMLIIPVLLDGRQVFGTKQAGVFWQHQFQSSSLKFLWEKITEDEAGIYVKKNHQSICETFALFTIIMRKK